MAKSLETYHYRITRRSGKYQNTVTLDRVTDTDAQGRKSGKSYTLATLLEHPKSPHNKGLRYSLTVHHLTRKPSFYAYADGKEATANLYYYAKVKPEQVTEEIDADPQPYIYRWEQDQPKKAAAPTTIIDTYATDPKQKQLTSKNTSSDSTDGRAY